MKMDWLKISDFIYMHWVYIGQTLIGQSMMH